ncbi:hypothetical protein SDJN02_22642 [Cucurbita argyrosperma subsp. argyrosperma]|nr:hypothetical protein SDJN02_22642 [Cucurbita argyrosperma subsp. argyrosperma]
MPQPSKEPCKEEACDIQACFSKAIVLPHKKWLLVFMTSLHCANARSPCKLGPFSYCSIAVRTVITNQLIVLPFLTS